MNPPAPNDMALAYTSVKPGRFSREAHYPLIVLLHGFGANMYNLTGLSSILGGDQYVFALPNAPYEVRFGDGSTGNSWIVNRDGVEPPPADLPPLDTLFENFMRRIIDETGAVRGKIVLAGFSQGGGVTLRYGLTHPGLFAGLGVMSGAFRDADEVRPLIKAPADLPIFIAHGRYDNVVPIEQGQATKEFLESAGFAPDYREYDMAHEITIDVLRDFRTWLNRNLPSDK